MQLLRRLSFTMLLMSLMTLVACGGGDGDLTGGDNGGGTSPGEITLSLAKSEGDLSGDNNVTVSATVIQDSKVVANKLVTFELTNTDLATFLPEVGTAVTNSDGIAEIMIKATNVAGGVEVTATITDVDPISIGFTSVGGGPGGDDGGNPVADSLSLFASSQQIASSGAQTITLTAIAKDGNNNLLEGVKISFAADSGALEKILDDEGNSSDVTGPDGKVTRKLSTLAEPTNRIISTTITSGTESDTLEVQVVGTSISLTGSSSLALNDSNNYIIKVLDSDGSGLSNTLVTLSLSNESTETPAGSVANITLPETVKTNFNGQASVSVIGTSGGTNTILASAHGANAQLNVNVQADSFLFTNFGDGTNNVNPSNSAAPDILLSKTATVTLTWLRSGVVVPDGTVVSFTTTRGTLASTSATTVAGKVTTTLTSTNAGKALLTFTGTDIVNGKTIELNNQLGFEFIADTADRLISQVYPQSIGPNQQTSTVSVIVRDPAGNLVKNKTIKFEVDDVSGGEIFPATAVTDSNGSASTIYTSNNTSAHNGVAIKATVTDTPSVTDTVHLTVADREVFIALGTGNSILQTDINTYNQQYSVFVTDIDSNPVPNVTLTVSAIPKEYWKSWWVVYTKDGEFDHYGPAYAQDPSNPIYGILCQNEDVNNNGILDVDELEDTNGDKRLTPGNIVNAQGTVTTNEQGHALIDIEYAEVFGYWANIDLIVSTKVNGTESFARALFNLSVNAEDVTDEGNAPATFIWPSGPFGKVLDCTNPN